MLRRKRQTVLRPGRRCFILLALAVAAAGSMAEAAGPLSLEVVKTRLRRQREKIESLHLRIRRETTLSVDPNVLANWSDGPALPEYVGKDEILVAFKGDRRYQRVLELDYTRTGLGGESSAPGNGVRRYVDEARAWTGKVLLERKRNLQLGKYEYRSTPGEKARNCFPPERYLMNVGLAVADPTASDEAHRNIQEMHFLPEVLERWPYEILKKTENIEGAACVVLEGKIECDVSEKTSLSVKLWLDLEHGLAVRKRERRIDGRLVRVVNRDFVEVLAGVWLPSESRTEEWASAEGPEEYREGPVLVRHMRLLFWVVNHVPDDLFDVALVKPRSKSLPVFDLAPVYHWREVRPGTEDEQMEEGWAVRGVGRRVEVSRDSKLRLLILDTPRWHFVWDPARNRVMASPSRLGEERGDWVRERAETIRTWEVRTGVFACQKERLGGKEVDKVTMYFPADPEYRGDYPIHSFEPRVMRAVSGTETLARTYWFDGETGLMIQRRCGCKPAKYHVTVDYPAAENLPGELFKLQIPPSARLLVSDPELGRAIYSEGEEDGRD